MKLKTIVRSGVPAGLVMLASHFTLHALGPEGEGGEGSVLFWLPYALVIGLLTAYAYALGRPRFGAGTGAGLYAGLLVWMLHEFMPAIANAQSGLAALDLFHVTWSAVEMSVVGVVAGALYRET